MVAKNATAAAAAEDDDEQDEDEGDGDASSTSSGDDDDGAPPFKEAAAGNAVVQFNLGVAYAEGDGVEQDLARAVHWYTKAAEQGDKDAQFNLGAAYDDGEGVGQDHARAVHWFTKAAEQDDEDAQTRLGIVCANGDGVKKNPTAAARWFTLAAEKGHDDSQYKLGVAYENGTGVDQDPVSRTWSASAPSKWWRRLFGGWRRWWVPWRWTRPRARWAWAWAWARRAWAWARWARWAWWAWWWAPPRSKAPAKKEMKMWQKMSLKISILNTRDLNLISPSLSFLFFLPFPPPLLFFPSFPRLAKNCRETSNGTLYVLSTERTPSHRLPRRKLIAIQETSCCVTIAGGE